MRKQIEEKFKRKFQKMGHIYTLFIFILISLIRRFIYR